MEVLCPSPNAEFLVSHVFEKAGHEKAPLFVPVLRRWAKEGKEVHGKRFSLHEVEEAITLAGAARGSDAAKEGRLLQSPAAGARGIRRLDSLPTPVRSAAQPASAPGSDSFLLTGSGATRPPDALQRPASVGEQLQHAPSSGSLGQEPQPAGAAPAPASEEKVSLSLRGARIDVRANPPRLGAGAKRAAPADVVDVPSEAGGAAASGEPAAKRRKQQEEASALQAHSADDDEPEIISVHFGTFSVPRLPVTASVPRQTLRISAGRAAAAAGIHPYTDIGDLFLEFVYQDLPDLLLRDAALVGVEIVSPAAERAKLMDKSGEMAALEASLQSAAAAQWVQGARDAQRAVGQTTAAAQQAGRLTAEEADELRRQLELEINLEFGARHEDAAIEAYSQQLGQPVYGQQRRVSLAMPEAGPAQALAEALPPPRAEPMSVEKEHPTTRGSESGDAYFRLTGFVDGLVDLPRLGPAAGRQALETLVVEVKHRIASIKSPPNLYDVVQLCCYCRVYGLQRGQLVQCLREETPGVPGGRTVGKLHVTTLDFSEGSSDRKGWDQHVLPSLYRVAEAVYATRADDGARLRLLAATTPEERRAVVGSLCPHLDK